MLVGVSCEVFDEMVLKVVFFGCFGKFQDVVGMVLFFVSEYVGFISVVFIDISGGMGGQIVYFLIFKWDFV